MHGGDLADELLSLALSTAAVGLQRGMGATTRRALRIYETRHVNESANFQPMT